MKFLVTGASGFIGRHLMRALAERGDETVAFSRDPRRGLSMDALASHVDPTVTVIHLAAQRNIPGATTQAYEEANVQLPQSLARAALGARRFVHVNTALALGSSTTALDETADAPKPGIYSRTRAEGMRAVEAIEGLPLVTILPTIVYGPDHPSAPNRVTAQMRRVLGRPLRLLVGNAPRNLVFIDDVVRAILAAADRETVHGRFIIGGEEVTQDAFERQVCASAGRRPAPALRVPVSLALATARAIDRTKRIDAEGGWSARITALVSPWCFSSARARRELGYAPLPLAEGIEKTVRSFS